MIPAAPFLPALSAFTESVFQPPPPPPPPVFASAAVA